jgi:hypothetical protein
MKLKGNQLLLFLLICFISESKAAWNIFQQADIPAHIVDVKWSPDGTRCLAAASGGKIIRSTDSGVTWHVISVGIPDDINAAAWQNASNAWATGSNSAGWSDTGCSRPAITDTSCAVRTAA